jgi:uncharacterized membrane protein YeaQ/YmgE (transglycosylase-associated protein family)
MERDDPDIPILPTIRSLNLVQAGPFIPGKRYGRLPMGIIGTIIIGLLAGIVAKLLMPGRDPGGFIVTTLLGIAGAFVATWIGQAVGWYRVGDGAGFIGAVVGAVIILLIYRFAVGRRAT